MAVAAQVTDRELYAIICTAVPKEEEVTGSDHLTFVADRVEVALRTCGQIGCISNVDVIEYVGNHFRLILPNIQDHLTNEEVKLSFDEIPCDALIDVTFLCGCVWGTHAASSHTKAGFVRLQIGEKVLKDFVFTHLQSPESKFELLVQMLLKLYALVNFQCCEDNADALSHHEILLPGQLLAKFFKERVEEGLSEFAQQVHTSPLILLEQRMVRMMYDQRA
jgi:DNA-directed RNA polymerase I subunit RPA2